MLYKILTFFHQISPAKEVYAHCDVPCGIYDPHRMQLAAHTVLRMTQLIENPPIERKEGDEASIRNYHNAMTRYVMVKEEHAEDCKNEIRILWGDYFKPEHVEQYPELHETVWNALKAASKTRQEVSEDAAKELLSLTQQIAEIFWKTKGAESVRQKSFYPTEGEIVYPKS